MRLEGSTPRTAAQHTAMLPGTATRCISSRQQHSIYHYSSSICFAFYASRWRSGRAQAQNAARVGMTSSMGNFNHRSAASGQWAGHAGKTADLVLAIHDIRDE
jgi:hypothetical protein|tara:strand:+ start:90 stop:398 length:309 start_codon:yes stop_codon:yes gene_type:complete